MKKGKKTEGNLYLQSSLAPAYFIQEENHSLFKVVEGLT
jgi:hypothetical protein